MNLGDVQVELGEALSTIEGLRVYPYTADRITPPAAVVDLPEPITFDTAFGNGGDRFSIPIHVLVSRNDARSASNVIAQYASSDGDLSIKNAIENGAYESLDSVRVESAEFNFITVNGVDFLGVTFTLDVIGTGN